MQNITFNWNTIKPINNDSQNYICSVYFIYIHKIHAHIFLNQSTKETVYNILEKKKDQNHIYKIAPTYFKNNQVFPPKKTFIPVLIHFGVIKRKRWTNFTERRCWQNEATPLNCSLTSPKPESRHAVKQRHITLSSSTKKEEIYYYRN